MDTTPRSGALAGEVVLVTGGASGLGAAIVDRFVEEGARLVVLDRSADRLAALADRHPNVVEGVAGDVRVGVDHERAVARAMARFGRLDCAIGNAGIWDYGVELDAMASDQIDAAFDEIFQVNVKGGLHLAKAALPTLVRSRGALILTVSNAGFHPAGGGVLYTASKHALVGAIRQLAYEFAPAVRVNGVAPGPIDTDLRGPHALGQAERSIHTLDLPNTAAAAVPLGVVPRAEDYAGGYVLLASRRDGRPATGGVLSLDAGIGARGMTGRTPGRALAARYDSGGPAGDV